MEPLHADFLNKTYIMMEPRVFFEPYRAVLEAFERFDKTTFPLKDYVLGWRKRPTLPAYLTGSNPHTYHLTTAASTLATVRDVSDIATWPTSVALGLNPTQRRALYVALTHQVALIQGPPGTGKSYVGRKIIAALLENRNMWQNEANRAKDNSALISKFRKKDMQSFWIAYGSEWTDKRSPIVVICLTNTALDQFLEGILRTTDKIIRFGSQSKSERLERNKLAAVKDAVLQNKDEYTDSAYLYHYSRMNAARRRVKNTAKLVQNKNRNCSLKLKQEYRCAIQEYNQIKAEAEVCLCRCADVIGLTTTGAAKKRLLLQLLGPKIVMVEEAAEVLESHILASLTSNCQHLIMIGDHKQLRPSVNVPHLSTKYHMDVSLFERLITNGVRSVVLGVQHRMRPEVARLIVPVVYDQLANHPSVCQYPNVAGMRKNVFFWNHQHDEERESDSSSFFNQHEVESSLALAHYLCQQGIQQEKITILATYSAQLRRMLSHRQTRYNMRSLDRVHLTTVDDYQGEENDVVILSLVRSNRNKVIGFLRIENRVCVALSRARHGLYILGNMNMLSGSSPLWDHVKKTTNEGQEIGMELVLKCDRHQNIIYKVKTAKDFPLCGIVCSRMCGQELQCGHPCRMPCSSQCRHSLSCNEYVLKNCNAIISVDCLEATKTNTLPASNAKAC